MKGTASLIQTILHKNSIEECGLHELQSITRQYPYFAPAHLLLAEKIRTLDEGLYEHQLERTALYVHNPQWFQYLLTDHTGVAANGGKNAYAAHPPARETNETAAAIEIPAEEMVEEKSSFAGSVKETTAEEKEDPSFDLPATVDPVEEKSPLIEEELSTNTLATTAGENFEPAISSPAPGEEFKPALTFTPEEEQDDEYGYDEEEAFDDGENESNDPNAPAFNIPSLKIEPLKETANDLLFEPYHTVDYFASQGIKTEPDEKPKDRFSHQLKSFTEWIKTMKRLSANELESKMDNSSEEKVQSLASHSLQDNAICTEAMAEVWLKQGDRQKAIDIYQKLSLQNPGKSPYFAAKIESLKNT